MYKWHGLIGFFPKRCPSAGMEWYLQVAASKSQELVTENKYKISNQWTVMIISRVFLMGKFFNLPSKLDFIFFKVRLSQKINQDFHNKWVLCDMVGTILTGGCSCMAGNSKTCSHVDAFIHRCLWSRLSTPLPPPPTIFIFLSLELLF